MAKAPRDPVQFTYESAERIANVVRAAETTPPAGSPLSFAKQFPVRIPREVRAATFSGAWPIGGTKTVTLKYAPFGTANAVNLSWPISSAGYVNEDCLVGREGTNWWLVVPVLETSTAIFVSQTASAVFATQTISRTVIATMGTQAVITGVTPTVGTINCLSDVSVSASLNTADCTISVSVSKTSTSHSVVTGLSTTGGTISVIGTTATAMTISGTSIGAYVLNTSTAAFLRVRVP